MPSNKFYYADCDDVQFSWIMSDVMLSERTQGGASYAYKNQIFYAGGRNLAGNVTNNIRYVRVNTANDKVKKSAFISQPFDVGAPKTIYELCYTLLYSSTTSDYEVLYRLADNNKVFGNWISAGNNNPVTVNQSTSFIQYMFRFTSQSDAEVELDDVTINIPGFTTLSGNLDNMTVLPLANSPYWVTGDISFTSGTHDIEAGVVLYFAPNTGLTVGRASVNFNGTQSDPITLTYQDEEPGLWNGVYFQDASDNSVSSVMNYTNIEKAGFNSWNANLYLYNTNQPVISHCTFSSAEGHGIRLENSSPSISSSSALNNEESGCHFANSNPEMNACSFNGNAYAGVYFANNCNPSFVSCQSTGNLYGLYSYTPDRSFTYAEGNLNIQNNGKDIAVAGGRIASNQTWNCYGKGYALLGSVEIYGGNPVLTIAHGNTIYVNQNCYIYVGRNSNEGGSIYAVGTAADSITFTAYNGEIGGWNGLQFRDGSDYNSSSSLRYCNVEKAVTDIYCTNTNQPSMMWCDVCKASNAAFELQNAPVNIEESLIENAMYGLKVNASQPVLVSVTISGMTESCVLYNNACRVTFYDCLLKDSYMGIRYSTPDMDILQVNGVTLRNVTYNIAIPGGNITDNRLWACNTYSILGTINIGRRGSPCSLTLTPGSTLSFANDTRFEVSRNDGANCYGELYAVGTESEPITFTSINGEIGGWRGLYFDGRSDDCGGQTSVLKYCIIEKALERNLHIWATYQPSVVEHCTFSQSASDGVYFEDGYSVLRDCTISGNGRYGIYVNNGHYCDTLVNVSFSGNQFDGVGINGGHMSENRCWSKLINGSYFILNDFYVGREGALCRLTIEPGCTVKVAESMVFQISRYYYSAGSHYFYGELHAIGTESEPIIFTSINGEIGGWRGLYFDDRSDNIESQISELKYCHIEKAAESNLHLAATYQPSVVEHCTFSQSASDGVYYEDGYSVLRDCTLSGNGRYGIYVNNGHYCDTLVNVSFSGNQFDGVGINGGHMSENRCWSKLINGSYFILNDFYVGREGALCRLTIEPGCTVKVAESMVFQISRYYYSAGNHYFYGELHAIGTESEPIIFTSINEEIGGWRGLYFDDRSDDYGGQTSVLKYCNIEKASEYDLCISYSSQPSVEHCNLTGSYGYGLRIDNASPVIKNSLIKDNGSWGILLTGNSNPSIGGSVLTGCDIYNNGLNSENHYNIYQDGSVDINMAYNYMGCADSVYVDRYLVYDKLDNSGKGRITTSPVSWLPLSFEHLNWNSCLNYDSNPDKPMTGSTIAIKDFNDNVLYETTVADNGTFSFNDLEINEANKVEITPAGSPANINSTDALVAMRHFTHQELLAGNRVTAADVNGSSTVNGTDALLIQKFNVHEIEEFSVGTFFVNYDTVSCESNELNSMMSFLWFGDANGNYNPSNREERIQLLYDGSIVAEDDEQIVVPVRVMNATEVGAVTLNMNYPHDFIEIEDVVMSTTDGSFMYRAVDGELIVSWYDLQPAVFGAGETLLNITVRTKDLSWLDEPITFTLSGESELADGEANAIESAVLSMPVITTESLGIGEFGNEQMSFVVLPNPMKDKAKIVYSLPENGAVTLTIFDMTGHVVMQLEDCYQQAGNYETAFDSNGLRAGVYYCRMTCKDSVRTVKIIIE